MESKALLAEHRAPLEVYKRDLVVPCSEMRGTPLLAVLLVEYKGGLAEYMAVLAEYMAVLAECMAVLGDYAFVGGYRQGSGSDRGARR